MSTFFKDFVSVWGGINASRCILKRLSSPGDGEIVSAAFGTNFALLQCC